MKLSELIAAYGDDAVQVQNLDECADTLSMSKGITKVTFGTQQTCFHDEGLGKLGLVVWFDRERIAEITGAKK